VIRGFGKFKRRSANPFTKNGLIFIILIFEGISGIYQSANFFDKFLKT
jgi:hypothetical protein